MIVILNDNGQVSLPTVTPSTADSQPVGAQSASSTRALSSRPFLDARVAAKSIKNLLPDKIQKMTRKVDEIARSAVSGDSGRTRS